MVECTNASFLVYYFKGTQLQYKSEVCVHMHCKMLNSPKHDDKRKINSQTSNTVSNNHDKML